MRLAPLVAALLLAIPAVSHAKCAAPGPFLVPASGDLPANPSLHLFFPSWTKEPPELAVTDEAGNELKHTVVAVPSTPAFHVLRIDVESGVAKEIVVSREASGQKADVSYRIDPSYASAPRSRVRITSAGEKSFAWTCSYQETRDLEVDTIAPLYRVEYAASEEAFRAGKRQSILLAHRTADLAFRWSEKPVPEAALLPLGHVNCTGKTLEWTGPIWAAVVAVFPDGSETPLGEPERIDPPSSSKGKGRDGK